MFHINLLTPFHKTLTHRPNYQCLPLDLVDGEEEYEVKKILDSQQFSRRCKLQYLVKWKGYPDSKNQWIDKGDVFTDKALQGFKTLNLTSDVKAPPMVGPTWTRVRLTLGLDCLPTLFQGTASLGLHTLCFLHCPLVYVRCLMIQGCTSTLPLSFLIHVCGPEGYTSWSHICSLAW